MRFSITWLLAAILVTLPLQAGEHSFRAVPELKKGLSKQAAKKILGEPTQVRNQNTCWEVEERWWYERKGLRDKVLLFTDGKLGKIEPTGVKR